MGNENAVHTHRILVNVEENKIIKFASNWMELAKIVLSELSQTRKDTHLFLSHVWMPSSYLQIWVFTLEY